MGQITKQYKDIPNVFSEMSYLLNQRNARIYLWNIPKDPSKEPTFIDGILNIDTIVLNGSSDWENSSGAKNFMNTVQNTVRKISDMTGFANKEGDSFAPQVKIRHPLNTTVDWKDSAPLRFTLPMAFFSISEEDNVSEKIMDLMKGVYPESYFGGSLLVAPMGYKKNIPAARELYSGISDLINNRNTRAAIAQTGEIPLGSRLMDTNVEDLDGCWGIEIGDWFSSPQIFVIDSVTMSVSSEQNISGSPLYAVGMVEVRSARILGYTEIRNFMKRLP